MKALARWTVGPCSKCGVELLRESVSLFSKLYPEIERVICYNQIEKPKNIDAQFYKQDINDLSYPLSYINGDIGSRLGSGWKLFPSRLKINYHELWIDNDIIIHKKMKEIDSWLQNNYCIISEGMGRRFGIFDKFVNPKLKICAGFFGLPPDFDFQKETLEYCKLLNGKTLGGWDEQGLVASVVTNNNHVIVPLTSLAIVEPSSNIPLNASALHFVEANRLKKHRGWEQFKVKTISCL